MKTVVEAEKTQVLAIGPSTELTGGMSAVVEQTLRLDYQGRYNASLLPLTMTSGDGESSLKRVSRHLGQVGKIRSIIRDVQAKIVHIHTCSGFSFLRSVLDLLTAKRMGARVVLHVHGAAFDEFYAGKSEGGRRFIRWGLSRADCVIALSDDWRKKLRAMAPDAKIVVVENAVDLPEQVYVREPVGACRFVLLAKMDVWKGIDDLLEACAILHKRGVWLQLKLAGPEGSAGNRGEIVEKITRHGLAGVVRYVGTVKGEEKDKLLNWADVYVQPSHNEGMPISLLEALAYGLPIVATSVGAIPEVIVHQKQGLVVPSRDPESLAEAMHLVAARFPMRRAMAFAARQLAAERFSLSRLEADLVSIYDDLIDTPSDAVHCHEESEALLLGR